MKAEHVEIRRVASLICFEIQELLNSSVIRFNIAEAKIDAYRTSLNFLAAPAEINGN